MVNRPALVELASGAAHRIRDRFVAAMADGEMSPQEEWDVLHAITLSCRLSDEAVIAQTTGLAAIRCGLDSPRVGRLVADAQTFEADGDVAALPAVDAVEAVPTTDVLVAALSEMRDLVAVVTARLTPGATVRELPAG